MTYKKLKKEFEKKVKSLQKECEHKRLTPWMEKVWAVAHGTGNFVRVCKKCNLEIMWKGMEARCWKCNKSYNNHFLSCPGCNTNITERRCVVKNLVTGEEKNYR